MLSWRVAIVLLLRPRSALQCCRRPGSRRRYPPARKCNRQFFTRLRRVVGPCRRYTLVASGGWVAMRARISTTQF